MEEMMKKLSKEIVDQIIQKYKEGQSPSSIAEEFGIYNNSVARILRKNGVERNQLRRLNDQEIQTILIKYEQNNNLQQIADLLSIDTMTVRRTLKKNGITPKREKKNQEQIKPIIVCDPKYGTTFMPSYNGIVLNGQNLKTMSLEDKNKVCEFLFDYYRQNGFPYVKLTTDELIKEFTQLKKVDISTIEKEPKVLQVFNQVGNPIFKHFSHGFYEITSGRTNKPSMLDTFNNDELLKKVIFNRVESDFNMTGNMLKQGLCNSKMAYKASIFNPLLAKAIYSKFTQDGDIIYDYSAGFGQRLLGALVQNHKIKYIGVDPCKRTIEGDENMFKFFNDNIPGLNKEAEFVCEGSENYCDPKYVGKVAFAFSSPPYHGLEIYSDEPSQAYHDGSYSNFINIWWKKTVSNIYEILKPGGIFALNIAKMVDNFNIADDMSNVAKEKFEQIDLYKMQLTKNLNFGTTRTEHKYEPIFIFKKVK